MSHRTYAAFAAVLALLILPAGAGAATKTAAAGPPLEKPPRGVPEYADANQFFPRTVSIHKGDTVRWRYYGFHTVVFPKKGTTPPGLGALSPTLKTTTETDPAGGPFWFAGQPQPIFDPRSAFPQGGKSFTGSKLTGSGAPTSETFTYKLKFPNTGSFTYYCTIHSGMRGTVKVVSKSESVPSSADDKKAVDAQIADTVTDIKRANRRPNRAGAIVELGRDSSRFALLAFFPAQKTVSAGTAVEFRMTRGTGEVHTASFFAAKDLVKGAYADKLSQGIGAPLPGPPPPTLGIPGAAFYPTQPGVLTYNGTQNGGFASTGFLDGDGKTPLPLSRKITFTTPGVYNYICLIHTDMKGTITVQ